MIFDFLFIIVTSVFLLKINDTEAYGLAALGNVGRFVMCFGVLIFEIVILVVLIIIMAVKIKMSKNKF